jgi:hypothetical protein
MVRKKPPLVADNPKDVLKSACPGCKMEVDESTGIRCNLCKFHSHINCMDVAPEEAQLLLRIHRRSSHLKLLCLNSESVFQCSPLSPIDPTVPLEDNMFFKYLRNIVNNAIQPLREEIFKLQKSAAIPHEVQPSMSYAAKVQQSSDNNVIFKPKSAKQFVTQTKSEILKSINPLHENIDITRVKVASNGGLIIGCSGREDGDKLIKVAETKLSAKYDIKKLAPILPRLRIVDISEDIGNSEFLDYFRKQNSSVITDGSVVNLHRFWAIKKNGKIFQAEISVDLDTYKCLLECGHVLVGLSSCSVYDAVSVTRCYRCHGFNHSAKFCKNNPLCPFCGKSHEENACVGADNETNPKCRNCKNIRMSQKLDIDCNHATFEHEKCFAFKLATAKFKENLFGITTELPVSKISDGQHSVAGDSSNK